VVKAIRHKAASPPQTDSSIVSPGGFARSRQKVSILYNGLSSKIAPSHGDLDPI